MHFSLSEEQELVRKTARDFATGVLAPRAHLRDSESLFPTEELSQLGKLGLLGVNVPTALGGAEAGTVAYSLVMEELARACAATAVAVGVTNMVAELIARFGTASVRTEVVPELTSGRAVAGAFALSEAHAGSDPGSMRTTAKRVSGGWEISGSKQWITSGDRARVLVVWAKTDEVGGSRALSAFVVRGGAEGLSIGRVEDKLGIRGSSTVSLVLESVFVPDGALLGEVGSGMRLAMIALDGGRIGIGSQAIGIGGAALDAAAAYARDRVQFGVPIANHQAIQFQLADSATWLDAARLLVRRAAWLKEQGRSFTREASMAKLYASEAAQRICDSALQIHGGYGFTKDYAVERYYRDVRVTRIYEGTSEIQRLVIARELFRAAASRAGAGG